MKTITIILIVVLVLIAIKLIYDSMLIDKQYKMLSKKNEKSRRELNDNNLDN